MSSSFAPNPQFEDEIKRQPEYRQALEDAADVVRVHATTFARQAHAPWMKSQSKSIVIYTDADTVAVVNVDHGGHLMEWGSRNNVAHAPLRRAVRAAGLRFKESAKGAA